MPLPLDVDAVTHSVQLAVAPVFFLTAVAGMISAVAGRLARIIDRARALEEKIRTATDPAVTERHLVELGSLRTRGRIANASIGFLALCGVMIGFTIVALFVGQTGGASWSRIAVACFLTGVGSFLVALIGFLCETILATQLLNFKVLEMGREFRR